MVARLASLAILLLPLAIGVPCAVGAPQAHLGDFSSTFAAEYGQPIGSQQLKAVHVLSYQGCPRATTPQRSVFFVQGVAIAVFVSPCGGPIPDDWRVRAKVFLPADSSFVSASPYQGRVQYVYKSDLLAEAAPGALCGASGAADGLAILQPLQGAYLATVASCVQALAGALPAAAIATPIPRKAATVVPTLPQGPLPAASELAASKTACEPFLNAGNEPRGNGVWGAPPKQVINPVKHYQVRMYTQMGVITADILPKLAPVTANNFIFLACDGFYDNVIFHRVIPGFVIQGGDPTGTGTGGPGYQFKDEKVARAYQIGDLAMANAGSNTNGSQFFIMQGPQATSLPQSYNLFGHVTAGESVVDAIAKAPTHASAGGENSAPNRPVHIKTITSQVP